MPQALGKMSLLPPDAAAAAPATLLCRYQPTLFAETRGENLPPIMIIIRLLSPEPVGWVQHHQLYSGVGADIVMESMS